MKGARDAEAVQSLKLVVRVLETNSPVRAAMSIAGSKGRHHDASQVVFVSATSYELHNSWAARSASDRSEIMVASDAPLNAS